MDIPRFKIGPELTAEQAEFMETHGFIKFEGFATPEEVAMWRDEHTRIQAEWAEEKREKVFGVPITWGRDENDKPFVNRMPFTSLHSEKIHNFLQDERFQWVRNICGPEYRLGEREKDGTVTNNYRNCPSSNYRQLGWHVDGLRDIFYMRLPKRMLNVGLSLTDSTAAVGGLRVIPGTHKQGAFGFLFGKMHFLDNRADKREVLIETRAGDLTLHDGRLWHRVARCKETGEASRRMNVYIPFLKDTPQEKNEKSRTPLYHYLRGLVG
ncbi:MAG: phytanoyl-CoA dioxygenase family protein [Planctomycetota bacterium]|jgi:hypothetical protein